MIGHCTFYLEANAEIQRLLRLPHMLPESWIIEVCIKRIESNIKTFTKSEPFQIEKRLLYGISQIEISTIFA